MLDMINTHPNWGCGWKGYLTMYKIYTNIHGVWEQACDVGEKKRKAYVTNEIVKMGVLNCYLDGVLLRIGT